MTDMTPRAPRGWKALRLAVIAAGLLLAPVFFGVMFVTVTALVRPAFGWWAWSVPAATEGSFAFLYGLDLLLQWRGKPMGWLRLTPYPFAVASLLLNVWADRASVPGMVGHAAVTCAFFLPLLAGESAVRSLAVSDDQIRAEAETRSACRYARDLLRDQRGPFWRWRVPSLLRTQVLRRTPPAMVRDAIAAGPEQWEAAVHAWLRRGLTRGDLLAAEEKIEKRAIAKAAEPEPDAPQAAQAPAPRRPSRATGAKARTGSAKDRAAKEYRANRSLSSRQLADMTGVSPSTCLRLMRDIDAESAPLASVRPIAR